MSQTTYTNPGGLHFITQREAALSGHVEAVKVLLDRGATMNATENADRTALHEAALSGHVEVVKVLLGSGATIDAAALRHIEVVKVLLKSDATTGATDDANRTVLHYAAGFGHFEVVKVLLGSGAAIDVTNMDGTVLYYATEFGHIEVVKVLLDRGTSTSIDAPEHGAKLRCIVQLDAVISKLCNYFLQLDSLNS